jgi:Putative Flp pilus-assembly TadE/G-like
MVLVAVALVGIMASMAMAIDLGMLYKNRSDAQRVADAASLAGAAEYLEPVPQITEARDNAVEYILKNKVGNDVVDPVTDSASHMEGADLVFESREATIRVMPTVQKVRVQVRRAENDTWFARLFGKNAMPVRAQAAAEAVNTGTARCLKPFALPDIWDDPSADTVVANRVWDPGEDWGYGNDGTSDRYLSYEPGLTDATGYGGGWRNGNGQNITDDYGRETVLKYQGNLSPNGKGADPINLPPSFYLTWRIPDDPSVMQCSDPTAPSDGNGEAAVLANVCHCNTSPITLFDSTSYFTKPGVAANPLDKAINQIIAEDPTATWDPTSTPPRVVGSSYGDGWISSPRVVKIALFSPDQLQDKDILNGNKNIVFNSFGLLFLEKPKPGKNGGKPGDITGRFLRYVGGDENLGPAAGPLVKYIKLVE